MRIDFSAIRFCVVAGIALGFTVLSSCGRAPEEPTPSAEPVVTEYQEPLVSLDFPLSNTDLGVTLTGTPQGLVATYNDGPSIEVTDDTRRDLRYTIFAERPNLPIRSPATIADFEAFIGKHTEGAVTDRGSLDTTLGSAPWAMGRYHEEEQSFEDLRIFIPHPSGTGTLIIASVGPEGSSSLEDRLAVIRELSTFIS